MTGIHLEIAGGKTKFLPGDALEGVVSWDFATVPQYVEVRLFWRTQGKGTEDLEVAQRARFDNPARSDRKTFRIPIPQAPYSFSGKLVSLAWGLEAVAGPGGKSERVNLTVSPTGEEILLHGKK
jgi:hypothetical protein